MGPAARSTGAHRVEQAADGACRPRGRRTPSPRAARCRTARTRGRTPRRRPIAAGRARRAGDRTEQPHAVGDAEAAGEAAQAGGPRGRSASRRRAVRRRRAARCRRARASAAITSSMPLRGTSRLTTTTTVAAVPGGAAGPVGRNAAGRSRRARPRWRSGSPPSAEQLVDLVAARGHARGRRRGAAAPRPARSGGLVSAPPWCRRLTDAQSVERLDAAAADRRCARAAQRRPPGHPEVGVHDVGPAARQRRAQARRRRRACGATTRPWAPAGRAGRGRARPARRAPSARRRGRIGVVGPGGHVDRRSRGAARCGGQRGDVDVLAAGVGAAERGQRAGVLGHQLDAEPPHRRHPACAGAGTSRSRAATDVGAGHAREAALLVERARAAAAAGARRRAGRRARACGTPQGRHRSSGTVGGERDDDGRADGRGKVHRAGVAADDGVGSSQHAAELAKAQPSSEIDTRPGGSPRTASPRRASSPPPVTSTRRRRRGDRGDHGAPPVGSQGAGGHAGPRVDDDVARCRRADLRARRRAAALVAEVDGQPVVGRGREPQRLGDEQPAPHLVDVGSPGMRTSSREPAWSWLTAAIRVDAGPAQQQGQRQRALVRRAEQGGVADARGPDPLDERVGRAPGAGIGSGSIHGAWKVETAATPGAVGRRPAPGAAEQVHRPAGRRDRSDRRTGQQDVAQVVEAGDEHGAPAVRARGGALTTRRARGAARDAPGSRPARTRSIRRVGEVRSDAGAAATSSGRVPGVGIRIEAAPARGRSLDVGADLAPITTQRGGNQHGEEPGAGDHPGRRLAAGAPAPGPCGHTATASNGPSRSSTRAFTADLVRSTDPRGRRRSGWTPPPARMPAARGRSRAGRTPGSGRAPARGRRCTGWSTTRVPSRSHRHGPRPSHPSRRSRPPPPPTRMRGLMRRTGAGV